jgi:hypothetical protein
MTEGVAFAVEELASDVQVEFVLNQRTRGGQTIPIVPDTALAFGRSMLHRFDVDWERHGFERGRPGRTGGILSAGAALAACRPGPAASRRSRSAPVSHPLDGPAIAYPQVAHAMDALRGPASPRARRRPSAAC